MAGEYGFAPNPVPSNGAYGDQTQVGGHLPSFQTGISGETNPNNTAGVFSLVRDADRFNSMVPSQCSYSASVSGVTWHG
jgi:hypothetical protein